MRAHRWSGWVLGLAILSVASSAALAQSDADKTAAVVNGENITMAEVKSVLDARPSPVPLPAAQQREMRKAALDMLIDDLLMRQFLRKHGGQALPAERHKEIDDLQAILKKD